MTEKKVPCEVWSRAVGYFRPVSQWNKGKQAEFRDRVHYKIKREENYEGKTDTF